MADVKIIDIDGEQWNIKDQNARDDIITIKEQLQTNTTAIEKIGERIKPAFKAINNIKRIKVYPYNTCFASGYINGVGAYMAVLSSHDAQRLDVIDICGKVSEYISVTLLSDFEFELSLDGAIYVFGIMQSAE